MQFHSTDFLKPLAALALFAFAAGAASAEEMAPQVNAILQEPETPETPNLIAIHDVEVSSSPTWAHPTKGDRVNGHALNVIDGYFGRQSEWRVEDAESEAWLEIDFGEPVTFDRLQLFSPYRRREVERPMARALAGDSPQPTNEIASFDMNEAINPSIYDENFIVFEPQTARYLRLEFEPGDTRFEEIEVFNGAPKVRTPTYEPFDTKIRVRESIEPRILGRGDNALVWLENSGHKVFRDDVVKAEGVEADPFIEVNAARGESEAFQIVIRNLDSENALEGFQLEAGALEGPATIPADAIDWFQVDYVYIRRPSSNLMTQNGSNDGLGKGFYPDILTPTDTVRAPAGKHQPIWVEIDVPRDAPAGEYAGELRLTGPGVDLALDVRLTVWDITMPETPFFKTVGRIRSDVIKDMEWTKQFFQRQNDLFFTGALNYPVGVEITEEDGKLQYDWTEFDRFTAFLIDELGFDTTVLPGGIFAYHSDLRAPIQMVGRKVEPDTPEFYESLEESLRLYAAHLGEKGWTDKFIFYITDEPHVVTHPMLIRVGKMVKEIMPEMKIAWVGGWTYPDLIGVPDIWCPNLRNFEIRAYDERLAAGDEVWAYGNSIWLIDTPPFATRALVWAWAKRGINGNFFYSLDEWRVSPWECAYQLVNRNGDNVWFYPDPDGGRDIYNSLRIVQMRDGVDDWELIRQLREAVASADETNPALAEAREALAEVDRLVLRYGVPEAPNREEMIKNYQQNPDDVYRDALRAGEEPARIEYIHDPDRFIAARKKIAEALVGLKK